MREHLRQLGDAHGFSLEELESNRRGQLHAKQIERGRRSGIGGAIFAVLLGLLFGAGGVGGAWLLHDEYSKPVSDVDTYGLYAIGGGGVLVALLFVGGGLLGFRRIARRRRAYERGQPLVAEAPLRKIHIRGRRGGPSQWRYELGGVVFQVSPGAWESTTHGSRYRVYHLAGDLLSIEPI